MRVGRSDVDDLHILILDKLLVGPIGLAAVRFRVADLLDELASTLSRGGRSDGYDRVLYVFHVPGGRLDEEVFGELLSDAACCEDAPLALVRGRHGEYRLIKR